MKLRELFEAGDKHITFCFGRMNPPTIGHKQLLDTVAGVGGDYKIFVSQTQDKKKNPLDYGTKIRFMKAMFPEYASNIVEDAGLNTVVKVAVFLYEQGYRHATFVAGSDRLDDMSKLLKDYNGIEGKAHGFYKFETLDFKSSGDREDGAEGVAGISASGARLAAANGDLEAFSEATGAGQYTEKLYAAVRKGMGMSEGIGEARMSAQAKLQRAFERERAKSDASRRRGDEVMAQAKKDAEKKKEQGVEEEWSQKYKSSINCSNPKGFSQKAHCAGRNKKEGVAEFAPPGGGDDDFNDDMLKRLAARWYNGDEDPRVERTLAAAGWEIGQDEGYDDEPGVFVVQAGDVNGNSYMSWPANELQEVEEHIVKVKGGYELKSKHGDKNLGKYPTRAGAEKRERQIQFFKHRG